VVDWHDDAMEATVVLAQGMASRSSVCNLLVEMPRLEDVAEINSSCRAFQR
jgi:hypothetical protein